MKILTQLWLHIRASTQEKTLFGVATIAFTLLVIAEIRWPVLKTLPDWLIAFLTDNALKSIISSVSASIVAAYVFYIFVELLPTMKRRSETLHYLDTLLFVVLDAFHDRSLGGPTLPLSISVHSAQRHKTGLTLEFVVDLENKLLEQDGSGYPGNGLNPFEQLAEAADARLPILNLATSMANGLSFHQGLIWSDITGILHQISLESSNTLASMTNDERRCYLLIGAIPLLKDWLRTR
ncbi:hypothetical protein SAMN05660284_00335 [Formivibrio citricus]|uniref:Uncharacterized protein n=1 Tax=Formivibrio citricus TaxID=83765 RepID=A0A1I4VR81_9NEIS|nr:hypothetical protein [Formivibrio citricus]SFN03643.1 hypothetical protein SAMN05660284_00335 [Formivibrio citricus]